MKAPDLCCHFTLNTSPDRCSSQHFLLIDSHWLSLHRSNKQSCWTAAHLTSSSSIFALPPRFSSPAGSHRGGVGGLVRANLQPDVTICYVAKAWCSSSFTFRERAALYCKCAINIHEGIYMHSPATLLVFISHVAHSKSYGGSPRRDIR